MPYYKCEFLLLFLEIQLSTWETLFSKHPCSQISLVLVAGILRS